MIISQQLNSKNRKKNTPPILLTPAPSLLYIKSTLIYEGVYSLIRKPSQRPQTWLQHRQHRYFTLKGLPQKQSLKLTNLTYGILLRNSRILQRPPRGHPPRPCHPSRATTKSPPVLIRSLNIRCMSRSHVDNPTVRTKITRSRIQRS